MSISDTELEMMSSNELTTPCNWCNEHVAMKEGKPYCFDCASNMYKECLRCHRPYPDAKYFVEDTTTHHRCNACHRKYIKEKERRCVLKTQAQASRKPTKKESTAVGKHISTMIRKRQKRPDEEDVDDDSDSIESSIRASLKKRRKFIVFL